MVRIRMVWKIKKNSLQTPVVVISSLKIARLLTPPEKMFLKLAASVGPSLLNQKARTTKHNEKNRKKILWMVCEKGNSVPGKPSIICPDKAVTAVVSMSKKIRVLSVGIYSNDENPTRIESDKETESTGI